MITIFDPAEGESRAHTPPPGPDGYARVNESSFAWAGTNSFLVEIEFCTESGRCRTGTLRGGTNMGDDGPGGFGRELFRGRQPDSGVVTTP